MMIGDIVGYLFVVATAFTGSLFACRNWVMRAFFTLAMPILYGIIWVVSCLAVGSVFALVAPDASYDLWSTGTGSIAAVIAMSIFALQVRSMHRDSRTPTYGYSLGGRRGARIPTERLLLPVPSQRRWMPR